MEKPELPPNVRPVPVVAEMNIRYLANGDLQFRGAPDNPVLFYGILELMRESYARMRAQTAEKQGQKIEAEQQPKIVTPFPS